MVNHSILDKLSPITAEEQAILDGRPSIDRELYMERGGNVVNASKLLESGKLITLRPHTRFVHFPEHQHDYVELVYMVSGKTTHIANGKPIELREGELLFFGQGARQEILPAGAEDIAVNFIILPQFFDTFLEQLGELETPLKAFIVDCLGSAPGSPGYLYFKVADVLPIQNLVENLLYSLVYDTPNKRNTNKSTMALLFLYLLNHTERLVHESDEEAALMQVFRYVESHYRDGSLAELAEQLHYDFYWLSREIKRKTGKTYTELLQDKRLSQAAYLLRNTRLKVSAIAQAVGYSNLSYFHRIFQERYGLSPKKYRDSAAV